VIGPENTYSVDGTSHFSSTEKKILPTLLGYSARFSNFPVSENPKSHQQRQQTYAEYIQFRSNTKSLTKTLHIQHQQQLRHNRQQHVQKYQEILQCHSRNNAQIYTEALCK